MAFSNVNRDGEQKPMVSREEYDKARAVLDALPPRGTTSSAAGVGAGSTAARSSYLRTEEGRYVRGVVRDDLVQRI